MSRRVDTLVRVDRPVMGHLARTVVPTSPDRVTRPLSLRIMEDRPLNRENIFHDPHARPFDARISAGSGSHCGTPTVHNGLPISCWASLDHLAQ
jgi:hypothetical protein